MAMPKLRFKNNKGKDYPKWTITSIGNVCDENLDPVPIPKNGYRRVGIYCHAKGTFQEDVPPDKILTTAKMFKIHKDNLIVNISFAWEHAIAIVKPEDEGLLVSHRFPEYKFKENQSPAFYRYLILQPNIKYNLMLASPGGAGRNRVLNKGDFLDIPISIPSSLEEQEKIAFFLTELDNLISASDEEVKALEDIKKGYMQKIFSQELRFKADDGSEYPEWEEKKFDEVFQKLKNNTLSRAELNYDTGLTKNIHYGDILVSFGSMINISSSDVPYITDNNLAIKALNCPLKHGDIVMADTAEDETVGKVTEIHIDNDEKVVSGLHTIPLRPKVPFADGYLGYYMNSNAYHYQLLPLMQGTKVTSVSKENVSETAISIPCLEEQQKIADFFTALDESIETAKQELEQYRQLKKAMLQQLFV